MRSVCLSAGWAIEFEASSLVGHRLLAAEDARQHALLESAAKNGDPPIVLSDLVQEIPAIEVVGALDNFERRFKAFQFEGNPKVSGFGNVWPQVNREDASVAPPVPPGTDRPYLPQRCS